MPGAALAYDPLSDEAMTDPRPFYARLVREDPVHYLEQYDAWAVAGFDAVWQICADTTNFSMRKGPIPYQVLLGEPASDLTFAGLDPPAHRLRRRVLSPLYTREAALADTEMIRPIVRDTLDQVLRDKGTRFDAYEDYAHVAAGRIAAAKAGVPAADADRVRDAITRAFHREPGQRGTSEANGAAMFEVFGYLMGLVLEARRHPASATGALATLLHAEVEGVPLTDEQVAAELHTLMVTGADTTEFGLTATLHCLAEHPDARAELLADHSLAAAAFAEGLRMDHPTDMLCRCVAHEVEVGRRTMQPGQGVLLLWAAANRDPHEFADPDRYDLHRVSPPSLVFGHGQHKCIGEHIGMRMGTIFLEELLRSVHSFEVDVAHAARRRGEFLKGYNRLPIEVVPR